MMLPFQVPSLNSDDETFARRARRLAILAPWVASLLILTLAPLSFKDKTAVKDWAVNLVPTYRLGHRRLNRIKGDIKAYFKCTSMLADSDADFDDALDIEEFRTFANAMATSMVEQEIGQNLPTPLRTIFTEYAQLTEGKSNQIIDIYGSSNGERDSITANQLNLLQELCNSTHSTIEKLFEEGHFQELIKRPPPEVETVFLEEKEEEGLEEEDSAMSMIQDGGNQTEAVNASLAMNTTTQAFNASLATNKTTHHTQPLAINTSFTMTMPDNMTVEELNLALSRGEDPGHLQSAFSVFTKEVVSSLAGNKSDIGEELDMPEQDSDIDGGSLISVDGEVINGQGQRKLLIGLDSLSPQIYKYVESACPNGTRRFLENNGRGLQTDSGNATKTRTNETVTAEDNAIDAGTNGTADDGAVPARLAKNCVTALGKYTILVDEEEEEKEGGLASIFQRASVATKSAIESGNLEKKLEEDPEATLFHVEGPGVVQDDDFDPYVDIEGGKPVEVEVVNAEEEGGGGGGLKTVDIVMISIGSVVIFCLCCVLCFVELERKTRPRHTSRSNARMSSANSR